MDGDTTISASTPVPHGIDHPIGRDNNSVVLSPTASVQADCTPSRMMLFRTIPRMMLAVFNCTVLLGMVAHALVR